MIFLTIFTLAFATATATNIPESELKSRNIFLPARRPEGRITNSQVAWEKQFPYQVGLYLQTEGGFATCGGSLLSNTKVLTAARCTANTTKGWIFLGSIHWQTAEVKHSFTSRDVVVHPRWKNNGLVNDISIITIPLTPYSNNIQPVQLPASGTSHSSYTGEEVIISGWGYTSDCSDAMPSSLRYAFRTVISNHACEVIYRYKIKPKHICIGTLDLISPCYGDIGGPMVLASTKVQIGIFSIVANEGCQKGGPAVYTRVTKYLKWIKKNAGI